MTSPPKAAIGRPRVWAAGALSTVLLVACAAGLDPSASRPNVSATDAPLETDTPAASARPFRVTGATGPYVEGGLEYFEWLAGCAAENGEVIEVIYGNPPAVEWNSGSARTQRVVDQCREAGLTGGWVIPSPFDGSAEANRLLYLLWIPVYECLRDNGYPTVAPPSEDTFVDQGSQVWNPYAGMRGAPLVVADPDTASGEDIAQLEAQELCGASAEALYEQQLAEEGG